MTRSLLILLIFFLVTYTLSAQQNPMPTDSVYGDGNITEFQRIANAWADAYNKNDSARLGALYTPDADYISSHVPSLVSHGRDNIRINFQKGMSMGGHVDTVEVLSSMVECGMASVVCRYQATNNGQTVHGRNLIVLKKINDRWLFQEHITVLRAH
jgi:ketosteroid isomerase-like protein